MSNVVKIGAPEAKALWSTVLRSIYFCSYDIRYRYLSVWYWHEREMKTALEHLYIGLTTSDFIEECLSIKDPRFREMEGVPCEGVEALISNLECEKEEFREGRLDRRLRKDTAGSIYRAINKELHRATLMLEIYKRARSVVPGFLDIEKAMAGKRSMETLSVFLEKSKCSARESSRQLRALGFVA